MTEVERYQRSNADDLRVLSAHLRQPFVGRGTLLEAAAQIDRYAESLVVTGIRPVTREDVQASRLAASLPGLLCIVGMAVVLAIVAALATGCGGPSWTPADAKSASDAVKVQERIEMLCASDDAGCAPSQVRALERSSLCNTASMLYRHGDSVPGDAGWCKP